MADSLDNTQRAADLLQNLFQSTNVFHGIPDVVAQEMKNLAEFVVYEPNAEILHQGDINKNLYFLINGTVDVVIDGGLVGNMRRKGDLLGEMSVVTQKPCSATIVAKTQVELIKIDTEVFRKKSGHNYPLLEQVLYRIYSIVLTEKINVTNQKAKLLEDTLDALSRAKSDLIQINEQMERRLAERAINLRTQLDDLLNKKLKELSSTLQEATKRSTGELQLHINKAIADVSTVSRAISPLVDAFNLEISLKNRNIVLSITEKKPQIIAKMALGGMGVKMHLVGSVDDAILHMQDSAKDLVVIDVGSLDLLAKMKAAKLNVPVLLIINQDLKDHVNQLVGLDNVPSIITIDEEHRNESIRAISTTTAKLLSPHVFGMERHLSIGVQVQELQVHRSDERTELKNKMREYFLSLGVRESILDSAIVVTEELLMNAIYDAPTDPSGNQIYNMLPRTTPVELKPDEYARLRFGCDGAYLAVSVEDPFGALSPDVLIKYLESCYSGRAGSLQVNKGGAGRGLHQIVEGSELVVFNVRPKRRTEVIALFNMHPARREEKRPMIQYCVQK